MSRAFTKEDAQQEDVVVVARAPLPDGAENLVTPHGLELLRAEESVLAGELAIAVAAGDERTIVALESAADQLALRLASAVVIDPGAHDKQSVRFGDTVTLRAAAGGATTFGLQIVGVDEADPDEDLISHLAPLARTLLGKKAGDRVTQGAGKGEREVEVVAIS